MFDLIQQIGELIESYRANNSDIPDFEILKKVFHGCHVAKFFFANQQLSLQKMQ